MNKSLLFRGRSVIWYSIYLWMFLLGLSCFAFPAEGEGKGPSTLRLSSGQAALRVTQIAYPDELSESKGIGPSTALRVTQSANQQTKFITGTVRDANGVLPGVTITVKRALRPFGYAQGRPAQGDKSLSSSNSVITDEKGQFSIAAAEGDTLVFTYVGYKTVAVAVSEGSVVNVTMIEDATTLQEVTVNAGYYTVKDKERTGSISKITAKEIEQQPVTNVLAAMQGRMAGVQITQTTGVSGGGFEIQIRGQNSLRAEGNSPLYLIDGVPYSSEAIGNSRSTGVLPAATNPLNSINPNDIESIEVLKDADATAIYGSRGANGVDRKSVV